MGMTTLWHAKVAIYPKDRAKPDIEYDAVFDKANDTWVYDLFVATATSQTLLNTLDHWFESVGPNRRIVPLFIRREGDVILGER